MRTFSLNMYYGLSIAISYDEKIIISGNSDNNIKIWDLQWGEVIETLMGHN